MSPIFLSSVNVTIYEQPMDVSMLAPSAVVLRCQADGQPVPEIVWIRKVANGQRTEFNVCLLYTSDAADE